MADFKAGPGKVHDETGTSCARKKETAQKTMGIFHKDTGTS